MRTITKIFVRVLSEGAWLGAWVPIEAKRKNDKASVFIIADNNLTENDEYEFFEPSTEVRLETFTD